MSVLAGIAVIVISLPCWAGQVVSWLAPETARRWKLTESPDEVDPVFHADIRGEARWDALTLWLMPLAGVLLVIGTDTWATVGLVAGGMYVYFGGRGIWTRRTIVASGHRVGDPEYLSVAYGALAVWAALGVAVIIGSWVSLA